MVFLIPNSRQQNKNTLQLAEKIRFEKEQEMLEDRKGYRLKREKESNFIRYFQQSTATTRLLLCLSESPINIRLSVLRNTLA